MRSTIALLALVVAACGSPTSPGGSSTLNMRLTDAPFADARAVLVTFDEVSVHSAEGAWTRVPFVEGTTRTCDLKRLQGGSTDLLGTAGLEAGHYTMIRLNVVSATLYFDAEASSPTPCAPAIAAPAGAKSDVAVSSGRVLLNRQFELAESSATTITLDFDGERSLIETSPGSYRMTPVVAIVSVDASASLSLP